MKIALGLLATLVLAGCGAKAEYAATELSPPRPDAAWMKLAEPLPETPTCDKFKPQSQQWVKCRIDYDISLRTAYVELAGKHASLVVYIDAIVPLTGKGE
ncbi:MAG: hypothetical protein HOO99_14625 [Hyphomicrobiaceae bacterium]|nr:hypothetical protein [Hyphomicrobiaceae bacterium]